MKIMLRLENLKTGESSVQEFPDEAATAAWLRERPRFVDVLGVVFEGLSREQNDRLKGAMRPLDEEEKAAEKALLDQKAEQAKAARDKRAQDDLAAQKAHEDSLEKLDPNRPMEVRYRYDTGIAPADPKEKRTLSDEAVAAVLAWVEERNEWVAARAQVVGEAKITLWPNALPKPNADRIQHGTFVPVTAPKKA